MLISEMQPEHIRDYINSGGVYSYQSYEPAITPSTYLEYARSDLRDGETPRSIINAVGNAKRALHLEVETLCSALGWEVLHKKKITGFDKRLEFIKNCGIISPRILSKLNRTRNKVEHEYFVPSLDEAQDYLDIVELFLFGTKQILDRFPYEIFFELMEDEELNTSLNLPKSFTFKLDEKNLSNFRITSGKEIIEKKISDEDYFIWLGAIYTQYLL